ncbi:hypothetical protein [Rhizobium sp.]|uniref:hypothetical protein n=1 Tax=Rhizobium sp. TaxID=391 RepID=UPI002EDDE589
MRAFIAAICLFLLCGNAVANSVQDSTTPADAIVKALYDNLSAAYLCRDIVDADKYLKTRSVVEATMLAFTNKQDASETILKKWEDEIQINLKYQNQNISVEECNTLLRARTHQLYVAMDTLFK